MRIAIIGGGISGLVAGYHLHAEHDITLFEANSQIGGHTNTVDVVGRNLVGAAAEFAVDTGFIVFNDRTYPNFIRLMGELGVASQKTRMSFSVSCERTGLEYRGGDLNGLFAQRRNLLNPGFHRLLLDFGRFSRLASGLLESDDENETVADFLRRQRFSRSFIEQYFLPMGAAIWSAPFALFQQFPIRFIAEFYHNHGLLGIRNLPQWRVIRGGSRSYLAPLTVQWSDSIRLTSPVRSVVRQNERVWVTLAHQSPQEFDHVIFACHSDQALRMLGAYALPHEREILSAFPYQSNTATLHTQASALPKNRRAWACWNYFNPVVRTESATVTYNMNLLQSLAAATVFCVTLNDTGRIRDENVLRTFEYSHPIFDVRRQTMQRRHQELINQHQVSFCGAYWGNGFHEDGVRSALAVTKALRHASVEAAVQ